MSECIETDVLILGCGVAGGTVALCLADAGMPVTLVTRAADPNDSNTNLAQGGIIYRGTRILRSCWWQTFCVPGPGIEPQGRRAAGRKGPGLVERILLERLGVSSTVSQMGHYPWPSKAGTRCPASSTRLMPPAKPLAQRWCAPCRPIPTSPCSSAHTAIDLLTPAHHSLNRLDIYAPLCLRGGVCVWTRPRGK